MPDNALPLSYSDMRKLHVENGFNVRDKFKGLSNEDLFKETQKDRLPYSVCALNITGDWNIGVMIRSAELLGAKRFILMGRRRFDKRTTVGSHTRIEVIKVDAMQPNSVEIDPIIFHKTMDIYNLQPIFIDTGDDIQIQNYSPYFHNKNLCLVFGNEGMGIPKELINDNPVVSIPMKGCTRSFNVAAAMSIACWEISQKY